MIAIEQTARLFFEACEAGHGWESCKAYCHADAHFSAQADALAGVTTVAAYCEWMKGLMTIMPDGRYEMRAFATDTKRGVVTAAATFHGTHTGPGGPVEPTGKSISADYVYVMHFDGDRISQMTKVWNDAWTRRDLGWP